ncbi:MAG: hypothetical protein ABW007_06930, partial [Chitinophagaceae bacterium]
MNENLEQRTEPQPVGTETASIESISVDEKIAGLQGYADTKLAEFRDISLADAMSKWDVVGAHHDPTGSGSYVLMAERDPRMERTTGFQEMGYAYPSPWTSWTREERVTKLRDKEGLRTYYDMKRADGTIRGSLRVLKTPIQSAKWYVKPASDSPLDKKIAEFVEDNLFERMTLPFSRVIEDALLMLEYGYFVMEKVYRMDTDGKMILQKLAPRHPLDIREWEYDAQGGPDAILMEPAEPHLFDGIIRIPIEKLVVFVNEQEGGDMRGISVLRSAYKHYYYKDTLYKIDAIQKERHGIGVPIIKLPMGFSQEDRRLADDLGRNLRSNERAHITIPSNWEVAFAKLEGQPVDCMRSIEHHDNKIKSNVLVPFLDDSGAK